jgi:hypothetical protein
LGFVRVSVNCKFAHTYIEMYLIPDRIILHNFAHAIISYTFLIIPIICIISMLFEITDREVFNFFDFLSFFCRGLRGLRNHIHGNLMFTYILTDLIWILTTMVLKVKSSKSLITSIALLYHFGIWSPYVGATYCYIVNTLHIIYHTFMNITCLRAMLKKQFWNHWSDIGKYFVILNLSKNIVLNNQAFISHIII